MRASGGGGGGGGGVDVGWRARHCDGCRGRVSRWHVWLRAVPWLALTRHSGGGGGGGVEVGVESTPTWGEHARWALWLCVARRPLASGHATWQVWRWVWRGLVEVGVERCGGGGGPAEFAGPYPRRTHA
ncbi:hypothetical protein K439DRAFT_1612488 [Ramaria rubella]|nr:hypothetical protein K439DRAFT_1612488 [Ramaria rubella]